MINIMYLVLTAILALNVSNEVINAFKVVDRSLRTSNSNIAVANQTIYASLLAKLNDAQSREKASIWKPKADRVKVLAEDIDKYIESLKLELKKGAGLVMKAPKENGQDSIQDFKEDNLDASTRIFETNGKGKELEARLNKFKQDIMALDPKINQKFSASLQFDTKPPLSLEGKTKDFTQTYFHMTPTVAALTMLSKFQNNIKNAENQVITYCLSQIGAVEIIYNKFQPIAVANSTYLMPGQEITVTAGVGAFNDQSQPVISFDGATTPLNSNGVAEKKFNVSGAGAKKVHVHITYKNQEGKVEALDKDIEYTVGIPGGAAVMLDKMNVFYIGVDNPVSISSGSGWDKTHVSMAGGTITPAGTPGKFTVRVSTVGKASITVNADGKASNYDFRVKNIPPPVLKVGTSAGGRVRSVEFKNQQFARADLENFDFEYRYSIIGATIYFSGANFPSVQTATISGGNLAGISAQLSRCIPGTAVTFDNVKVQGPGGPVLSIPGPGFILY
jgi:gliding motility-associated protein GldM